ncbi:MAG: LPS assembly lipoprotein LptE, partial [Gammaproteobacteria bacterium]
MITNLVLLPRAARRWLLIITTMVLLASCGFHLRGSVDLPKDTKQLAIDDGESASAIATTLHTHLRRNGIKPLQNTDEAKLVIEIHREGFQRRVLTVNTAGQVQEFELTYRVSYSLLNKDNEDVSLRQQSLVLRRDLRF